MRAGKDRIHKVVINPYGVQCRNGKRPIKKLSFQFHGLSPLKCRQLAYEFAKLNDVAMPENWLSSKRAGQCS